MRSCGLTKSGKFSADDEVQKGVKPSREIAYHRGSLASLVQ